MTTPAQPTPAQTAAYAACMAFDRQRFEARIAGRGGFLSVADETAHVAAYRIVEDALNGGVFFNREAA